MKIVINDLMEIQGNLDSRIFALHNTTRAKTRNDRILALLVEASELANETRCFKYWSLQKPSKDDIIFEEFSDVLHFTLSLGIDIDFNEKEIQYETSKLSLNEIFHQLYQRINTFSISNTTKDYKNLLRTVFELSLALGMSGEDIREMYLYKNEKNHQRQDNNY